MLIVSTCGLDHCSANIYYLTLPHHLHREIHFSIPLKLGLSMGMNCFVQWNVNRSARLPALSMGFKRECIFPFVFLRVSNLHDETNSPRKALPLQPKPQNETFGIDYSQEPSPANLQLCYLS